MFGAMKQMQYEANLANWFYQVGSGWAGQGIQHSTTDANNNIYITGNYSTGTADSTYIVKINAEGVVQWGKFYGRPGFNLSGPNEIRGMITDSNFLWAVSSNSNATNADNGLHLLKISLSDGSLLQDYFWDSTGPSVALIPRGIGIANNNLIISNSTDAADYGGVISMTKAGTINWTAIIGTAGLVRYQPQTKPAIDTSNNIYVASTRTVATSNVVVQVTKINSSGSAQWDKYLSGYANGNASELYASDIQVAPDDSIYVLLQNQNWWGDGASTNGNLVKFDTSGAIVWQVTLRRPTNFTFTPDKLSIDNAGNIYVIGQGNDSPLADFIGIAYKFNSSGTLQWARQFENNTGVSIDYASGVEINVSKNDAMYVSLTTTGTGAYAWSELNLPNDGSQTGVYTVGNAVVTYGTTTATSITSNLILVSATTSSGTYSSTNFANVTTTTANAITVSGTISYFN